MKWYEAKSIEELREIGSLRTVKMEINKDIRKLTGKKNLDGFIKMGSRSWKGQYDKILALKKIINIFEDDVRANNVYKPMKIMKVILKVKLINIFSAY